MSALRMHPDELAERRAEIEQVIAERNRDDLSAPLPWPTEAEQFGVTWHDEGQGRWS